MRHLVVAVATVVLLASLAAGQMPSIVTEAEFLEVLDADHPAVAVRQEALGIARAAVIDATTLANPEVELAREDPADQIDFTLSWPLPLPSRHLLVSSAEHGAAAAATRFSIESLALRIELRTVYAEWAVANERAHRFAAHAQGIAELAERELARAERGETSGLEAQRLSLAASETRSRLALILAESVAARAQARGWHPGLSNDIVPALPRLPTPPDPVGAEHPLLLALEQELEAARLAQQGAERFVRLPELVAGWQRQEVGSATVEGPIVGLAWPLPLVDRNRAERARTATRAEAARARLAAERQRLEAQRAGARGVYAQLAAAAGRAAADRSGNERLLAGAVAAFQHGEASLTDLLETLRSAAQAEMTALDLHAAALAAHRELEGLEGRALDLAERPNGLSHGAIP